ncbi:hypothetical protein ACIHCX_07115 [Streptomyces sp. NPDC052043]
MIRPLPAPIGTAAAAGPVAPGGRAEASRRIRVTRMPKLNT